MAEHGRTLLKLKTSLLGPAFPSAKVSVTELALLSSISTSATGGTGSAGGFYTLFLVARLDMGFELRWLRGSAQSSPRQRSSEPLQNIKQESAAQHRDQNLISLARFPALPEKHRKTYHCVFC